MIDVGEGYHYEHHLWPSIPYWNLPKVRRLDTRVSVVRVGDLLGSYGQFPRIGSGAVLASRELSVAELNVQAGAR